MFIGGVFKGVDSGHLRIHLLLAHYTAYMANTVNKNDMHKLLFSIWQFCPHGSE